MSANSRNGFRTPDSPCFFIVGYGRSGTTLLRRMLSAHPDLFVPPENDIFQKLPPRLGRTIRDAGQVEAVFATFPPYYDTIYDLDALRTEILRRLPMSLPELFVLFFDFARIGAGRPAAVWGHKMPSEWPYVPTWRRWFPKAKFVHVVRNPLSSNASMVKYQLQRYRTTPLVAAWQWRQIYRAIRREARTLGPERYRMVKYEDLVAAPEATLAELCGFLGVSPDHAARMLDYRNDPATRDQVDEGAHMQRANAPLTLDRAGHSDYDRRQQRLAATICAREMAELGYPAQGAGAGPGALALGGAACAGLDVAWAGLRAARRLRGQL